MEEVSTIGLDIAKSVFQAHGAEVAGRQLFSRRLTRSKVIEFFAAQPLFGGDGGMRQRTPLGAGVNSP